MSPAPRAAARRSSARGRSCPAPGVPGRQPLRPRPGPERAWWSRGPRPRDGSHPSDPLGVTAGGSSVPLARGPGAGVQGPG